MPPKTFEKHPLTICFRLLETLGKPGKLVWTHGKTYQDVDARLAYLRRAIAWLRIRGRETIWRQLPVDFETFVESPALLNKKGTLWPKVMEAGVELNSGKYTESVLTGAIGVAKTTLAVYTQAFQVYQLSCMASPHAVFDLDPASEITTIFQSKTKDLATDLDYGRFRNMIETSPYFVNEFQFDGSLKSQMKFPNNIVVKPVSGSDSAAIGQNVIGGIIDEINFMAVVEKSKQTRDGGTYDQAIASYNSLARRRESRFMQMGVLPGMLCLVSSRNYPGQFTDKKEAEARTNPHIFVYDKRLWELRPERYSGEWFRVFVGDETRKPRILEPDETDVVSDDPLVMAIPVEHRRAFENDLLSSLRDIAGVATMALHPYILNTDAVAECFGVVQSIASREDCDFKHSKLQLYPKLIENPNEPRFVHVDLALSKDSAGVTIGHVPGFAKLNRGDYIETLPIIQFDMILEVRPPQAGEIEFENIRRLLYTLRDKLRVPVKWVTFDQYQSRDTMQILHQNGFIVGSKSMDVDTTGYDVLKQAFYDRRVRAPAHPKAQRELITLEIDTKKNKIDHPPHSSKDVSDSMAGVAWGLTMRREIWLRHNVPLQQIPRSIKEAASTSSERPASYMDRVKQDRERKDLEERRAAEARSAGMSAHG